ncbi:MAG: hypothetical protein WKF97_23530 [Chitinophagaceae bacterium]
MTQDANDEITYMTDLQKLLHKLDNEGFTDQYKVQGGKLHNLTNEQDYLPEDVSAINFYRFEGPSDPDDMSICYVIETNDGRKGTLTDAYGVYADKETGDFMQSVEIFKKTKREDKEGDQASESKGNPDMLPEDVLNKAQDPDSIRDPLEQQLKKNEQA